MRMKDVVLMATVSSFENMTQPGRNELKQFSELFEPVFRASSIEARRNAVAAMSRCPVVPDAVAWFIASQPIALSAIFITRSPALSDDMLVLIARTHGPLHARAVAAREQLSVKVIDALVSLHTALEKPAAEDAVVPRDAETALIEEQGFAISREEQLRQQLKSLVHRDTLARAAETPDSVEDTRIGLLVRFARLREGRQFSFTLAEALGSSRWLSERIMLDLSGQQLATALFALGLDDADGMFVLSQFYPHLNETVGRQTRVETLWSGLDLDRCEDRMRAWLKADDLAEGRVPADEQAANENDVAALPQAVERPVFGRRRAAGTRR